MRFVRAGAADRQPDNHYDAILCMAVLRHGGLGVNASNSCAHLITFAAFEKTVGELAR
jgi:hypothetical protein